MGKIKSTIDLVMEKTEGLTLSEEEKRALEEEEETRGSQVLCLRYLRGDLTLKDLVHDWERSTGPQRAAILRAMVEGMQLGTETFSRGLQALEQLVDARSRSMLGRFRNLSNQFGKILQKRRRNIKTDLWAELAKKGIEGSAVEPNVEASPQWDEAVQGLQDEFAPRLDELKRAILQ